MRRQHAPLHDLPNLGPVANKPRTAHKHLPLVGHQHLVERAPQDRDGVLAVFLKPRRDFGLVHLQRVLVDDLQALDRRVVVEGLLAVERLQFGNLSLALDLDGSAAGITLPKRGGGR